LAAGFSGATRIADGAGGADGLADLLMRLDLTPVLSVAVMSGKRSSSPSQ